MSEIKGRRKIHELEVEETNKLDESGYEKARYRTSLIMTAIYVTSAVIFGLFVIYFRGRQAGFEFYAGYLVEQSLSVDNLFVFLMLFNYFRVPLEHQGRVLTWGIIGAVVMRGFMIICGVAAVRQFKHVILLFAAILLVSAVKLFFENEDDSEDLSENLVMKLSKRLVGAVDEYDGDRFFTKVDGVTRATPLFLCLVCIELSDFVFAVDSIPAVIGVSQDLLVVYSSNIFAILGLRSLYTLVAKAVSELPFLRPAVALVLGFIGLKMILEFFGFHIPIGISLLIVMSLLLGGVLLSVYKNRKKDNETIDKGHSVDNAIDTTSPNNQSLHMTICSKARETCTFSNQSIKSRYSKYSSIKPDIKTWCHSMSRKPSFLFSCCKEDLICLICYSSYKLFKTATGQAGRDAVNINSRSVTDGVILSHQEVPEKEADEENP